VQRTPDAAAAIAREHAAAQHRPRRDGREQDGAGEASRLAVHERQAHAVRGRVGIAEQPLGAVVAGVHVELLRDPGRLQHGLERGAIVGLVGANGGGHGRATLVRRGAPVNGPERAVDRSTSGP
jgi:hypothetical protein